MGVCTVSANIDAVFHFYWLPLSKWEIIRGSLSGGGRIQRSAHCPTILHYITALIHTNGLSWWDSQWWWGFKYLAPRPPQLCMDTFWLHVCCRHYDAIYQVVPSNSKPAWEYQWIKLPLFILNGIPIQCTVYGDWLESNDEPLWIHNGFVWLCVVWLCSDWPYWLHRVNTESRHGPA
jgi:hypothetical protein